MGDDLAVPLLDLITDTLNTGGPFLREDVSAMGLDLTGVYAKLDRAYDHLESLEQEAILFMNRKPYGLGKKIDDEGRCQIGFLNVYRYPSASFGILIGDCASNFRAALDHLVYAVARATWDDRTLGRLGDSLMFPIRTDSTKWLGSESSRLNSIPDEVRAKIERNQPYNTHNPPEDAPLHAIEWLNNRDKHRVIHTVASYVLTTRAKIEGRFNEQDVVSREFTSIPLSDDGAQVMRIDFSRPVPEVEMELDMTLQIFVRGASVKTDIRELLSEAGQHIQRIVADVAELDLRGEPTSHLT